MRRRHTPTPGRLRPLTRRDFLEKISRYGGAAVFGSLFALDLLARDRGGFRIEGRAPIGARNRVLVLGGGVGGLATAHELRKLGYHVLVLEARSRPGGRCWTVRGGTTEAELNGDTQTCRFAPGEYLNAGPMRIAHHHGTTLDYCREFGLPLVPFPNFNQAAFIHRAGQPRRRIREVLTDLRGHTSELLAKVVNRDALDLPLTAADRERLVEYLRAEGRLDHSLVYPRTGDTSEFSFHRDHPRGYEASPGTTVDFGAASAPLELEALVKAGFATANVVNHELNQQETMLTIPGGMDRLAFAFAQRLEGAIRYQAEVREVRRTADGGARVTYRAADTGTDTVVEADYCVCAVPPHLLQRLENDFSPATRAALQLVLPDASGKVGLQFKRRFWEQDDDIYGGRSLSNLPITQLYYPCENFGAEGPAVMIGTYHFSEQLAAWDVSPGERERRALEEGAQIHPQYPAEFENSFSVEWQRTKHSEIAWPWWRDEDAFKQSQAALGRADGPFYFSGDWTSVLPGWQAGSFVSAHATVRALHQRANAG